MGDVEKKPVEGTSFTEFLSEHPPGTGNVIDLLETKLNTYAGTSSFVLRSPDVSLECKKCEGSRFFECTNNTGGDQIQPGDFCNAFLTYICRNCRKDVKIFAVCFRAPDQGTFSADVYKIGEFPPFGPRTPSRLITLIGPDRDLFLKGRTAENQGMGVGAFAYYRRVVENSKNRLLYAIIKVCTQIGADQQLKKELEAAKNEKQFSKAVDGIKHTLPDSLMIQGHNPLKLLHGPLSVGIHELSDEQCLEMATDIRQVLAALAERMAELLKDEKKPQSIHKPTDATESEKEKAVVSIKPFPSESPPERTTTQRPD